MKTMKLTALAIVAIAFLVIASCKKKTDPVPVDTAIKDASGNVYHEVTIGTQVWLKEDLRTTKYNNGDVIPNEKTVAWINLNTGAYCIYNNLEASTYGYLYNNYVATDVRGVAPKGFHVATQADWEKLMTSLGGAVGAGGRLKEEGFAHWNSANTASNSNGFSAFGGGFKDPTTTAKFDKQGDFGYWWTSTPTVVFVMKAENGSLTMATTAEAYGFSIRCVKN
jgi:uncharacterized protein (TIGR02145 family)